MGVHEIVYIFLCFSIFLFFWEHFHVFKLHHPEYAFGEIKLLFYIPHFHFPQFSPFFFSFHFFSDGCNFIWNDINLEELSVMAVEERFVLLFLFIYLLIHWILMGESHPLACRGVDERRVRKRQNGK